MKPKAGSLRKSVKISKPLARMMRKTVDTIINIRINEVLVTIDSIDIKMIMCEH